MYSYVRVVNLCCDAYLCRWRNLVAQTEERLNGVKDAMGENRCGLQPVISGNYFACCGYVQHAVMVVIDLSAKIYIMS
jgi:hypothetical protein